jgi:hypothetical protein
LLLAPNPLEFRVNIRLKAKPDNSAPYEQVWLKTFFQPQVEQLASLTLRLKLSLPQHTGHFK